MTIAKVSIHCILNVTINEFESFEIKSMQSKAFDESVNKAPKVPLLSTPFFHFSIIAIRQCVL